MELWAAYFSIAFVRDTQVFDAAAALLGDVGGNVDVGGGSNVGTDVSQSERFEAM